MSKLLIAGASGFVGQALVKALKSDYRITVIGRDTERLKSVFSTGVNLCSWNALDSLDAQSYDAIINLAGLNITEKRWTPAVKTELIVSRVKTTTDLITWAMKQNAKPAFYCANAIGIYGIQSKNDVRSLDEGTAIDFDQPKDFLSEIGIEWQKALNPAIDYGMSVTSLRFGVVINNKGGMLKRLIPSFKLGLGAIVGDGNQIISWIHIDDLIKIFRFLLSNPTLNGVFNLTAPNPLSQKQFARIMAKTMHRPLFLKLPAFMVKLLFGEMGENILLEGQRVFPKRLLEEGYEFKYPELELALQAEIN